MRLTMNKKINNFNLVEIIIAMGIIVVCLTTVMGLFSAGMKVSKDSSMKSYANIIIEQVIGMYDTGMRNPTTTIKSLIPQLAAATVHSNGAHFAASSAVFP